MTTTTEHLEATRNRLTWTLFAGNAIGSTGYIGIATVSALIAEDITGSTTLSGLPATTTTLGVAAGAGALSWLSYRNGRRPTFTFGYAISLVGSMATIAAVGLRSFPLLLVAMLAVGFGRAVGQLSRYAAGDLRTSERRAAAISLIVWASTIGAIVGPLLIGPTGTLALTAGFDELVGPVAVGVVAYVLVTILMYIGLRPDPLTLAAHEVEDDESATARSAGELWAVPTVRLGMTAIVVSAAVMVLVMVMTPIHIKDFDGSLSTVGWVMGAHTLGMFAIAPVTGWLVGRLGARRMIGAAIVTFVASCALAATAVTAQFPVLLVSLFGLGVAWNFGFVSGSTLVQERLSVADRLKVQGIADSSAWISSALAATLSGVVLATTSYSMLAVIGAVLAVIPLMTMFRVRTA